MSSGSAQLCRADPSLPAQPSREGELSWAPQWEVWQEWRPAEAGQFRTMSGWQSLLVGWVKSPWSVWTLQNLHCLSQTQVIFQICSSLPTSQHSPAPHPKPLLTLPTNLLPQAWPYFAAKFSFAYDAELLSWLCQQELRTVTEQPLKIPLVSLIGTFSSR